MATMIKTYQQLHVPTGVLLEKEWSEADYQASAAVSDKSKGLPQWRALEIMNMWNKGTHHDYRYWIE